MGITYREAEASDAPALLEYLKIVGGESDNLTFGAAGLPLSVQQEEQILTNLKENPRSRMLLAFDDGEIVGNATVSGTGNPRFAHRRELAVSVRRSHWGRGIGTGLIEQLIDFSRDTGAEIIWLEVRSDNERAKALYRKLGFQCFGTFPDFFKIGGAYYDADYMTLNLKEEKK